MKTSSTTTITITLLDWARLPSLTQMLATATATVLLERDLSQESKVVGASIAVLAANSNLAHGIRCCRQPLRLIFMCTDFYVPSSSVVRSVDLCGGGVGGKGRSVLELALNGNEEESEFPAKI